MLKEQDPAGLWLHVYIPAEVAHWAVESGRTASEWYVAVLRIARACLVVIGGTRIFQIEVQGEIRSFFTAPFFVGNVMLSVASVAMRSEVLPRSILQEPQFLVRPTKLPHFAKLCRLLINNERRVLQSNDLSNSRDMLDAIPYSLSDNRRVPDDAAAVALFREKTLLPFADVDRCLLLALH